MSLPPDFAERMAILRSSYLTQLEPRIAALELFIKQCARGVPTQEELEAIRMHAHSLAGSGSTYGFADISTRARALELEILDGQGRNANRLIQHGTDALTACKRALMTRDILPRKNVVPVAISGASCQMLVVDDDPSITSLVQHLLQEEANVAVARDGETAWKILAEFTPDLIILDELMPNLNGLELLERIRASALLKSVPVVMLTASSHNAHVGRATSLGIVDFIAKPFVPELFLTRVRHVISGNPKSERG